MRNQVLNSKCRILLFAIIVLTYVAEGIGHGEVCEVGDILAPGESCTYPGTDAEFSVLDNGNGQFLFFSSGNSITLRNTTINGVSYTLVASKLASGSWEIEEIADSAATTTNTAPTFTDGASTTRAIAENTAANADIGNAVAATDPENDTLTYTLSGTDAASFDIESATGQLKTKSSLDYEAKSTYTVTITVSDGALTDTITVTINITDVEDTPVVSMLTPVCDRTPQVRDAIVAAVSDVSDCNNVTQAHLATITTLNLQGNPFDLEVDEISVLKAGDFSGLVSLKTLRLGNNKLTTLPTDIFSGLSSLTSLNLSLNNFSSLPDDGIFDELTSLTTLWLHFNQLTTLPDGIFDELTELTDLSLGNNRLTALPPGIFDELTKLTDLRLPSNQLASLPDGVFDGLTGLTELDLSYNQLSTLPAGIFDRLSALTGLNLTRNQFSTLPAGIFDGLTKLTALDLLGNTVSPLPLTVSLQKVAEAEFKAVVPTGAPFDIVLPVNATNGNIGDGATDITIPKGSVASETRTLTRTPGTSAAVTVDIGILPSLPRYHTGYTLVKSGVLPVEVISVATVTTPDPVIQEAVVNIPDPNLRAKIENALGKASGDPISAAEMETLISLTAQDASISNLTGLETATNLTTLKLGNNTISDISAIAGLTNLTELQLWDNTISNISAVAGLTDLTRLYLWGNTITDISPVAGLTNLTHLRLAENSIANISAVVGLTQLTHLNLKENSISDISSTAGLTDLTELVIGNNTISDITPVANLTKLVWLDMANNTISDVTPVARLTNLIELYFEENSVSDLTPLVTNPGLGTNTEIDVRGNPLNYPSIYTHLPALQSRGAFVDFDNRVATAPVKISGDTQQGNTGTVLAQPFVVEVRDGDSVVFAGVPVTFAVTTGVGTLSATSTTTNDNGQAESTLTLGSSVGTNTVSVSVQGVSQTITFTATATTTNTAPIFTEGASTTRTIAENTAAAVNIGGAIAATDADNNTLTYTLGGTNAASFSIDSTTGQLKTSVALDYETKSSYTVTVTVSDGSLTDTINVTINVTNVNEVATNRAPVFTEGISTTRAITENTTTNTNIGTAIGATDADSDTLTYTLSGTDGASFSIDSTTGQLKTSVALDYETKSTYTVTITVSDGSLTDTITVTINVTNIADTQADTGGCTVGDVLAPGESCTYPGTDATFSVLDDGTAQWNIPDLPPLLEWINQTSISDSLSISATVNGVTYHFVAEELSGGSWEIKEIGDTGTQQPDPPQPPEPPEPQGPAPTLSASTAALLTEATLHEGVVTLTLSDGTYEQSSLRIRNAITVSGINGVTKSTFGVDRVSDTQVTVKLEFDGNISTDSTLTFTVESGAIADYDGTALTAQLSVTTVTESLAASTAAPLTETTLDGSVVTLTLSGRTFEHSSFSIRRAVTVSGIDGVTVGTFDVDRVSDTQVTVELTFDGTSFDTTSSLTFTVGVDAIAGYGGPPLTAQVTVIAGTESLTASTHAPLTEITLNGSVVTLTLSGRTYERSRFTIRNAITLSGVSGITIGTFGVDRVSDTEITVELTFNGNIDTDSTLTFTLAASAIANYEGSAFTAQIPVTAGTESLVASTDVPLTEANLHETVVTLTLSGRTYERSRSSIRDALTVSGINGVTVGTFDIDRVSDTEITVELTFSGDIDTDATLTFTVEAGAIEGYGGPAFTTQVPVTAGTESLVASTDAPLTEATLDESVVTLTLIGRTYERSRFRVRDAVTVSGINGVTVGTFDVDRVSDTGVTLELTFDGTDFDTDATLTFTVEAGAIAGYDGAAFTVQLPVTAGTESLVASTDAPLTEATLHESVVTLTLSGRTYERSRFRIRDAVMLSGISGVTVATFGINRVSDTQVTVELEFDGNFQTDAHLAFTVDAEAISGYNGPALTAEIPVTAGPEADANNDGVIDIQDLVLVASNYGQRGRNAGDVNGDRVVNSADLLVIASALDNAGAAPSAQPQVLETFTAADVRLWLSHAQQLDFTDPTSLRGILFLEQLLAVLLPTETVLLPNYPNPFNPETWIPHHLAKDTEVALAIYDTNGQLVRQFGLGHQAAGRYQDRSRAIYWNGKNEFGEQVASGVYFYHLSAEDYSATRKMIMIK